MLIIFKCTAGGNDGWGNILRLKIIFEKLKKKINFNYLFVVNNNLELIKFLKENRKLFKIFTFFKKEKEFLKKCKINISILELLNCKSSIQRFYKLYSKKLVVLDDIAKKKYISDILIICQKKNKFKIIKSQNTKVFNDYSFFPLEDKFNNFLKKKTLINKEIKKITIFLGGGFYYKEYFKIAKILSKHSYNINFILGYEVKKKFLKEILKINKNFECYVLPKNIPELIYKSDLIISGGGYTKIECAYLGKPMITVPIHRHQIELCKEFKKEFGVNFILKSNLNKFLNIQIQNYNYEKRKKISKIFKKKFSENGVNKIQNIILNEK